MAVCLEGKALTWYQLLEVQKPISGWETFKKELFGRFHGPQMSDLCEKMMALRHTMTMDYYREKFKALTVPLKDVSEEVFVKAFKNGLRPDIRADLHLFEARSLA